MISCRHGHLPKDPLANTVTLRVRASIYELQGTHSFHKCYQRGVHELRPLNPVTSALGEGSGCFVIFTWKALACEISLSLANSCSLFYSTSNLLLGFLGDSVVKNSTASAGDAGLTPGLGRSPVAGNSDPLQDSLLGNPTDRGGWQATVHGLAKSRTWLNN